MSGDRAEARSPHPLRFDLRQPRADTAMWLGLPRSTHFPSAVLRSVRHLGRERSDVGIDCSETFEIAFYRAWVRTKSLARAAEAACPHVHVAAAHPQHHAALAPPGEGAHRRTAGHAALT